MLAKLRSVTIASRAAPEAEEVSHFFLARLMRDVFDLETQESVPGILQVGATEKTDVNDC